MFQVKVKVNKSEIDGFGVFAEEKIKNGQMVWKYDNNHDRSISISDYDNLEKSDRENLSRIAYLSPTSSRYIFPPEGDPAHYTNHDPVNNNLSVLTDLNVSSEPYFIANRDIQISEEITNNYHEFDAAIKAKSIKPDWL